MVTVNTSAANELSNTSSSPSEKNAKLIGGLVGSIGGTIVIGLLVALFLFLKKRKKVTNQSPDFNDNTSGDSDSYKDKSGFKKLFSSKNATYGGVAGLTDIERQNDSPLIQADGESNDESDDFVYRGVSNNNDLDSVFRSTASNSSGHNSVVGDSANQNAAHTRMNSIGRALDIPYEASESEEHDPFAGHSRINSDGTDNFSPSDYDIDQDDLVPADRGNIFGEDVHSNNSRSRFQEEII